MLIPAISKKYEIIQEFRKLQYTDNLMLEVGCCDNYMPNIIEEPNRETYQYAIVNSEDKLIGYIGYEIDWYSSCAHNFGLMSFDKGNALIGKEVYNIMMDLIENKKLHRIEWYMVGGNPAERSYDKLCQKYNGNKIILHDVFKDRNGNYRNSIIYEIIQN